MFHLRRAALRALSAAPPSTFRVSSRISPALSAQFVQRPLISSSIAQLRLYATEPTPKQETQEQEAESSLSTSAEATESREEQQPPSVLESATDSVKQTASQAVDAVQEVVGSATGNRPHGSDSNSPYPDPRSDDRSRPSSTLYVGNLYFEISEETIKREFEKFGQVNNVIIIRDARGLSKGFAYVKFAELEAATEARAALNSQVLEGRRMAINYAVREGRARREPVPVGTRRNAPSRCLFIGNMSYEMTDRDLNELFREIKNVTDVRVAIDRRTGQPRGFAHADFLDLESAEAAATYLESREFYGRMLRVDFSESKGTSPRGSAETPPSA